MKWSCGCGGVFTAPYVPGDDPPACPTCLERDGVVAIGPKPPDRLPEQVDHPAHYGGADAPYEAIKVIEAWKLGFNLGNAVKYIARAEHKGATVEDLEKARWYLDREIANRKAFEK